MPTVDLTSQYLGQQLPNVVQAIGQIFDPRQRAMMEQARQERELFPLKRAHLEGQTSLNAARALTEGAHQGLYGAQTEEQRVITNFRNQLGNGGAQPQIPPPVSPLIDSAAQSFNDALRVTPGAPAVPQVPAPQGGVQPPVPQIGAPSQAPNPLLPALGGTTQTYDPMRLAMLAAAVNKNPNPSSVVEAMSQSEALRGGVTEPRSRELLLAQGIAPNVNTAVTPQWQGALIDNKNAQATGLNNADNAAAMERTVVQQKGAGERTVMGAALKAMYGKNSPQAIKYTDQRKMSADAGEMADRVFKITRDPSGTPSSNFGANLSPNVLAQRDQLARRISGHLMNQKDIGTARDLALTELFGSPNTGDSNFFTQGADPLFGWSRPFSAVNVNATALGTVDRTASDELNGGSPAAAAMLSNLLGIGGQKQAGQSTVMAPPQETPAAAPAPAPQAPKPDPYAMRPSNAEVQQGKGNKAYADMLRAEVAGIEKNIATGQQPNTGIDPWSAMKNAFRGGKPVDLNSDNDARNALIQRRARLLEEIQKLDPQTSGKTESIDDIANRYSP